jgi:ribulose-phosphate 3-epimerase
MPKPAPLIAPSILSADFTRLGAELRAIEEAGADWVHVDVMDGCFVPNLTFGPVVLEAIRKATRLPLDVHLMIVEPERQLAALARAGADSLTVHVEACPHLRRTLEQIHELGKQAGVALNPHTPEELLRYVLDVADRVLVMSVNPGFGGQDFLPAILPKLRALRASIDASGAEVQLEVDGGINPRTASAALEAGADMLVAGSAIFHAPDYAVALRALRAKGAP